MPSQNDPSNPLGCAWFVLNYITKGPLRKGGSAEDCIRTFNERQQKDLKIFAPTFIQYVERKGSKQPVNKNLTFHYTFVRGKFDDIKKLCGETNNFSFVLNRSSEERYAIVEDADMESFRKIANNYSNRVPYYSLEGVNLQDWDKVEVIDGDFPGLIGYYCPVKGSKNGRIVVRLTQSMGSVAYNINARYIRVLEFSKKFNRAYDLIDAFIPKLYKALRKYASQSPLSETELTEICSFSRRMGSCRFDNHKIEAKLLAILTVANHILGNEEEERKTLERFEKRASAITSVFTKAYICLIESVAFENRFSFLMGENYLKKSEEKKSKAFKELTEEYDHYRSIYHL